MTGIQGPFSDLAKKYYAEGEAIGEARGEARAVIKALAARDISITEEARERISGCTDLDQLDAWIRRAATVDTIEALFEGGSHGEEFGAADLQASVGEAAEGPGQEYTGRQADRDGGPA